MPAAVGRGVGAALLPRDHDERGLVRRKTAELELELLVEHDVAPAGVDGRTGRHHDVAGALNDGHLETGRDARGVQSGVVHLPQAPVVVLLVGELVDAQELVVEVLHALDFICHRSAVLSP